MTNTTTTKPKPAKSKRYMLVRYSRMNVLGLFEHNETQIPKMPARVVVKTDRGLELGYLIGHITSGRAGHHRLNQDLVRKYFDDSEIEFADEPAGRVIRYATTEDVSEEKHLQKIADDEAEYCEKLVAEMNLSMKIVESEHIFGGERVIFYFTADGRVDFRDLVKKLAQEYQTRIEMRQIGSRDEAKILGDVESCGQQCCCQRFLTALKPVNMRMAKVQKATLDPAKISGYCGRLKCCLRYEDKTYSELKKLLPRKNARVKTKYGLGKVVDAQILTQLVVVEHDDGMRMAVSREEIEIIPSAEPVVKKETEPDENIENESHDTEQGKKDKQN